MRTPMKLALVMAMASVAISTSSAVSFQDSKVAGESDTVGVVVPADVSLENKAVTSKKGIDTAATLLPTFSDDATQSIQQTDSTEQTQQTETFSKPDTALKNKAVTSKKGIDTAATLLPTFSDDNPDNKNTVPDTASGNTSGNHAHR
ncbi:hypothetical protein ON010_g7152 [Phytophthora cinnamomi]|nr:hypothetical protein ON010_g7152 [Phytophthora cinnamomi]